MPPSRTHSNIGDLLSMANYESGEQGSSYLNALTPKPVALGNPNTHKNAGNKRNMSTIFNEAMAQKQDEDNKKTQKILQMYKKIKNNPGKHKQYRGKHKNQESQEAFYRKQRKCSELINT